MKKILIIIVCILCILPLAAKVKLPAIIGNDMVLQQNANANLWGWSAHSQKITIKTSWDNKVYTTRSAMDGAWKIQVQTPSAGGPFTITISDGDSVTLTNILIGEVWLCSGQSNMEIPVKGFRGQPIKGSCDAIATAMPSDDIRMITLKINSSQTLLDDCIATPWMESTSANVADFSATAYFFANYLHKVLKVPVGVFVPVGAAQRLNRGLIKRYIRNSFRKYLCRY